MTFPPVPPEQPTRTAARAVGPARTAALLGLLAAVMSAIGSWQVSLWSDEAATISAAGRSTPDLLRLVDTIDAVHGTYYALMHPWVALVGTSPVGLRLPSALAVGAAVAGVWLLTVRLAGPATGLLAAVVTALLPRVTWAGIEARPFALALALAVWATVVLEAALRRRSWRLHVVYAVLLALGTAVNLYVVLIAAGHLVTVLAQRDRRALLGVGAAAAAGGVLALPVVLTALRQGGQLGEPDRSLVDLARNVVVDQWFLGETPTPTSRSGAVGADLLDPAQGWKLAAILLAVVCWGLAVRAALRAVRERDATALLRWALPWALVPTGALLAASLVSPSLYNARYFAFCAPPVAMLVAAGLRGWPVRRVVAAGLVLALLVAPVYLSQRTTTSKSGADWSMVAAWLEPRTQPGDAVYFGPRDPFVDGVVRRSLRTASIAYPAPFTGLADVTLVAAPAQGATLFGTSRPLEASVDRLEEVPDGGTLWVLRRQDRTAEALAEDALLADQGFTEVDRWDGPQTQVLELRRG